MFTKIPCALVWWRRLKTIGFPAHASGRVNRQRLNHCWLILIKSIGIRADEAEPHLDFWACRKARGFPQEVRLSRSRLSLIFFVGGRKARGFPHGVRLSRPSRSLIFLSRW